MTVAVRFFSKGGNTKKIAKAVAEKAGVSAKTVFEPLEEDTDILFLCVSPYGFDIDDAVKTFIGGITVKVGKAVLCGTSAMIPSVRKYVEPLLAKKNIPLEQEEFFCRGSFLFLHKGRPNEEDTKAAAEFAGRVIARQPEV